MSRRLRVVELGSYIAPAYAGMLLAEQGHDVTKWWVGHDPILGLRSGAELWAWINHRKRLVHRHLGDHGLELARVDVVVDNIRASTWAQWRLDPARLAREHEVAWVSLRDEFDGRSFDAIAQARATMDTAGYVPFYLGDTSAGLWLAFKVASMAAAGTTGHTVIRQASALAKLREGELVVRRPVTLDDLTPAWDLPGTYGVERDSAGIPTNARVDFRGEVIREPVRDEAWRWKHLDHDGTGRIHI